MSNASITMNDRTRRSSRIRNGVKLAGGKVFFTVGGNDYVCSGNSVASTNGSTVSTSQWINSEDINYDMAFAKVQSDTAAGTLSETVGASGVAFKEERGLACSAYGYPADVPFDGEGLEQCHGTASDDTLGGTQSQGIDCDMTGGSSGGPWFIGGDAGGYQNSVNSFGYKTQANVMYGPYFGDEAKQAYQEAEVA